jgi:hypothetical protein
MHLNLLGYTFFHLIKYPLNTSAARSILLVVFQYADHVDNIPALLEKSDSGKPTEF